MQDYAKTTHFSQNLTERWYKGQRRTH